MAKNLIVLRCGKNSLHRDWLIGANPNFDVVLCAYQEFDADGLPMVLIPGQKWVGIYQYLKNSQGWKDYDYIWLPDDDVATDILTINRFFELCCENKIELAAPALSEKSFFSHPITMINRSFRWRRTSFVELMVPCFSVGFLMRALETMTLSKSGTGFGLEFLWAHMLSYRNIMIFDETQVWHTRPVGKMRDQGLEEQALHDMELITHGMTLPQLYKTLDAMRWDGRTIGADQPVFLIDYLFGYRYLVEQRGDVLGGLLYMQGLPVPDHPQVDFFNFIRFRQQHDGIADFTLSKGKPSLISSVSRFSRTDNPAVEASGGNNGVINGHCRFHTDYESDPWWQVDLVDRQEVCFIDIYNRLDQKSRCRRVAVLISDDGEDWALAASKLDDSEFGGADGLPLVFQFDPSIFARFVRIQMIGEGFLHLDQVEVFGDCAARRAMAFG
ncbi:MAG TPA: discoidin domain-containing protein [Acidiphilium sp.]|nr:MAG: hypothetical protein B7Z67_04515 [Acidiphilium sp. 21-60-14]OYV90234.1 MAG: hypothetical protein B7Z57_09580 [Acidiphilium sp. 37-60-79]OZB39598.1 MAG: hypothetical protein B7X48_08240 [Acidiphilium sp. 34-60-192]HQT88320.1 discoidin domain-containing protein [Acidiphilium sp.]HQU23369.1 discoidin domain-containing protein [Acidiphilium sp.]